MAKTQFILTATAHEDISAGQAISISVEADGTARAYRLTAEMAEAMRRVDPWEGNPSPVADFKGDPRHVDNDMGVGGQILCPPRMRIMGDGSHVMEPCACRDCQPNAIPLPDISSH